MSHGTADQSTDWDSDDLAGWYANADWGLTPDEVRALAECWPDIRDGDVLDIGIGSGRTSRYLAPAARRFIGIDYSAAMVRIAKARFPSLDLRVGDARKLEFPDSSFSFVMFSFNGIDCVDPEDRSAVLAEVLRVLKPGGTFVMSAHNLRSLKGALPGFIPPERAARPGNLARRAVRRYKELKSEKRALANYNVIRDRQWIRGDVALVCDGAHESTFLFCYIDPAEQVRQIVAAGFEPEVLLLHRDGRTADATATDTWVYYKARKPSRI